MIKKTFGAGVNLPPEFLNALEDLSYSKPSNEVGHLPLPPNYGNKPEIFTTSNNSVDLSSASTEIVFVVHNTSLSVSDEILTINGLESSKAHTIILIKRGMNTRLEISLPGSEDFPGTSVRTTINLQRGSNAIFTYFKKNDGKWMWKYYELEYGFQRPIPHNIDLYDEDPIELSAIGEAGKKIVISTLYLQINQGKVDATLEFLLDCYSQSFGGDFFVALVDDNSDQKLITKHYHLNAGESLRERIFSMRFVHDAEIGSELSIKAWYASQGGCIRIKNIKLSGFWAGSDPS